MTRTFVLAVAVMAVCLTTGAALIWTGLRLNRSRGTS